MTGIIALTIFAAGVFIAAGSWGGLLVLVALGALAGWAHAKKMRKTTYALSGLLALAAVTGSASAFSSSPASQVSGHSSASGSDVPSYCELTVTWSTGTSMEIAESLPAAVSTCGTMASELTQGSEGDFTVAADGTLSSMPAGICSDDGVTLVQASMVSEVACDGLEQDINYLVLP